MRFKDPLAPFGEADMFVDYLYGHPEEDVRASRGLRDSDAIDEMHESVIV